MSFLTGHYINANIARLATRYVGQYLEGIEPEKFEVAWKRGNLQLSDVHIRKQVVELFSLPVSLVHGWVGSVNVSLPLWNLFSLRRSATPQPLVIELTDLYVVLAPKPEAEWDDAAMVTRYHLARQKWLDECDVRLLAEKAKEQIAKNAQKEAAESSGWVARLAARVVADIQFRIRSLHLRYEDELASFSFGVTLSMLEVRTPSKEECQTLLEEQKRRRASAERNAGLVEPSAEAREEKPIESQSRAHDLDFTPAEKRVNSDEEDDDVNPEGAALQQKLFSITNIAAYWNSADTQGPYYSTVNRQSVRNNPRAKETFQAFMRSMVETRKVFDEALDGAGVATVTPEEGTKSREKDGSNRARPHYVLQPFSCSVLAHMKHGGEPSASFQSQEATATGDCGSVSKKAVRKKTDYVLVVQLASLNVVFNKEGFKDIGRLMTAVKLYQSLSTSIEDRFELYAPYRPEIPVKSNPGIWWRFAVSCIVRKLRAGFPDAFQLKKSTAWNWGEGLKEARVRAWRQAYRDALFQYFKDTALFDRASEGHPPNEGQGAMSNQKPGVPKILLTLQNQLPKKELLEVFIVTRRVFLGLPIPKAQFIDRPRQTSVAQSQAWGDWLTTGDSRRSSGVQRIDASTGELRSIGGGSKSGETGSDDAESYYDVEEDMTGLVASAGSQQDHMTMSRKHSAAKPRRASSLLHIGPDEEGFMDAEEGCDEQQHHVALHKPQRSKSLSQNHEADAFLVEQFLLAKKIRAKVHFLLRAVSVRLEMDGGVRLVGKLSEILFDVEQRDDLFVSATVGDCAVCYVFEESSSKVASVTLLERQAGQLGSLVSIRFATKDETLKVPLLFADIKQLLITYIPPIVRNAMGMFEFPSLLPQNPRGAHESLLSRYTHLVNAEHISMVQQLACNEYRYAVVDVTVGAPILVLPTAFSAVLFATETELHHQLVASTPAIVFSLGCLSIKTTPTTLPLPTIHPYRPLTIVTYNAVLRCHVVLRDIHMEYRPQMRLGQINAFKDTTSHALVKRFAVTCLTDFLATEAKNMGTLLGPAGTRGAKSEDVAPELDAAGAADVARRYQRIQQNTVKVTGDLPALELNLNREVVRALLSSVDLFRSQSHDTQEAIRESEALMEMSSATELEPSIQRRAGLINTRLAFSGRVRSVGLLKQHQGLTAHGNGAGTKAAATEPPQTWRPTASGVRDNSARHEQHGLIHDSRSFGSNGEITQNVLQHPDYTKLQDNRSGTGNSTDSLSVVVNPKETSKLIRDWPPLLEAEFSLARFEMHLFCTHQPPHTLVPAYNEVLVLVTDLTRISLNKTSQVTTTVFRMGQLTLYRSEVDICSPLRYILKTDCDRPENVEHPSEFLGLVGTSPRERQQSLSRDGSSKDPETCFICVELTMADRPEWKAEACRGAAMLADIQFQRRLCVTFQPVPLQAFILFWKTLESPKHASTDTAPALECAVAPTTAERNPAIDPNPLDMVVSVVILGVSCDCVEEEEVKANAVDCTSSSIFAHCRVDKVSFSLMSRPFGSEMTCELQNLEITSATSRYWRRLLGVRPGGGSLLKIQVTTVNPHAPSFTGMSLYLTIDVGEVEIICIVARVLKMFRWILDVFLKTITITPFEAIPERETKSDASFRRYQTVPEQAIQRHDQSVCLDKDENTLNRNVFSAVDVLRPCEVPEPSRPLFENAGQQTLAEWLLAAAECVPCLGPDELHYLTQKCGAKIPPHQLKSQEAAVACQEAGDKPMFSTSAAPYAPLTLRSYQITVKYPTLVIPVSTSSEDHVRLSVSQIRLSNLPRVEKEFGLLDDIAIRLERFTILTGMTREIILSHVDLEVHFLRGLLVTVPPHPTWMTFCFSDVPWFLTPERYSLLLRIVFENILKPDGDENFQHQETRAPLVEESKTFKTSNVTSLQNGEVPDVPADCGAGVNVIGSLNVKESQGGFLTSLFHFTLPGLYLFLLPDSSATPIGARATAPILLHANCLKCSVTRASEGTTSISVAVSSARMLYCRIPASPLCLVLSGSDGCLLSLYQTEWEHLQAVADREEYQGLLTPAMIDFFENARPPQRLPLGISKCDRPKSSELSSEPQSPPPHSSCANTREEEIICHLRMREDAKTLDITLRHPRVVFCAEAFRDLGVFFTARNTSNTVVVQECSSSKALDSRTSAETLPTARLSNGRARSSMTGVSLERSAGPSPSLSSSSSVGVPSGRAQLVRSKLVITHAFVLCPDTFENEAPTLLVVEGSLTVETASRHQDNAIPQKAKSLYSAVAEGWKIYVTPFSLVDTSAALTAANIRKDGATTSGCDSFTKYSQVVLTGLSWEMSLKEQSKARSVHFSSASDSIKNGSYRSRFLALNVKPAQAILSLGRVEKMRRCVERAIYGLQRPSEDFDVSNETANHPVGASPPDNSAKTKLAVSAGGIDIEVLNDAIASRPALLFLQLQISQVNAQAKLSTPLFGRQRGTLEVSVRLTAWCFNPRAAAFEPFLEKALFCLKGTAVSHKESQHVTIVERDQKSSRDTWHQQEWDLTLTGIDGHGPVGLNVSRGLIWAWLEHWKRFETAMKDGDQCGRGSTIAERPSNRNACTIRNATGVPIRVSLWTGSILDAGPICLSPLETHILEVQRRDGRGATSRCSPRKIQRVHIEVWIPTTKAYTPLDTALPVDRVGVYVRRLYGQDTPNRRGSQADLYLICRVRVAEWGEIELLVESQTLIVNDLGATTGLLVSITDHEGSGSLQTETEENTKDTRLECPSLTPDASSMRIVCIPPLSTVALPFCFSRKGSLTFRPIPMPEGYRSVAAAIEKWDGIADAACIPNWAESEKGFSPSQEVPLPRIWKWLDILDAESAELQEPNDFSMNIHHAGSALSDLYFTSSLPKFLPPWSLTCQKKATTQNHWSLSAEGGGGGEQEENEKKGQKEEERKPNKQNTTTEGAFHCVLVTERAIWNTPDGECRQLHLIVKPPFRITSTVPLGIRYTLWCGRSRAEMTNASNTLSHETCNGTLSFDDQTDITSLPFGDVTFLGVEFSEIGDRDTEHVSSVPPTSTVCIARRMLPTKTLARGINDNKIWRKAWIQEGGARNPEGFLESVQPIHVKYPGSVSTCSLQVLLRNPAGYPVDAVIHAPVWLSSYLGSDICGPTGTTASPLAFACSAKEQAPDKRQFLSLSFLECFGSSSLGYLALKKQVHSDSQQAPNASSRASSAIAQDGESFTAESVDRIGSLSNGGRPPPQASRHDRHCYRGSTTALLVRRTLPGGSKDAFTRPGSKQDHRVLGYGTPHLTSMVSMPWTVPVHSNTSYLHIVCSRGSVEAPIHVAGSGPQDIPCTLRFLSDPFFTARSTASEASLSSSEVPPRAVELQVRLSHVEAPRAKQTMKRITVAHSYILQNMTEFPIHWRQYETELVYRLDPGETMPLEWTSCEKPFYLSLQPEVDDVSWQWGGRIAPAALQSGSDFLYHLAPEHIGAHPHRILRVQKQLALDSDPYSVAIIRFLSQEKRMVPETLRCVNHTTTAFSLRQNESSSARTLYLDPNSDVAIGWDDNLLQQWLYLLPDNAHVTAGAILCMEELLHGESRLIRFHASRKSLWFVVVSLRDDIERVLHLYAYNDPPTRAAIAAWRKIGETFFAPRSRRRNQADSPENPTLPKEGAFEDQPTDGKKLQHGVDPSPGTPPSWGNHRTEQHYQIDVSAKTGSSGCLTQLANLSHIFTMTLLEDPRTIFPDAQFRLRVSVSQLILSVIADLEPDVLLTTEAAYASTKLPEELREKQMRLRREGVKARDHSRIPAEFITVCFEDMRICWIQNSDGTDAMACTIQNLQIDNQLPRASYPIAFQRLEPASSRTLQDYEARQLQEGVDIVVDVNKHPLVDILVHRRRLCEANLIYFSSARCIILGFVVQGDTAFVATALDVLKTFTEERSIIMPYRIHSTSATYSHACETLTMPGSAAAPILRLQVEPGLEPRRWYFERLIVHPLLMQLSFSPSVSQPISALTTGRASFITRFLSSIGTVRDVPLYLSGFRFIDTSKTCQELKYAVKELYIAQLWRQIYLLATGVDLLGNPLTTLSHLGAGLSDLVAEPIRSYQEADNASSAVLSGIRKGATSFLGHTVYGAFNVVSKVSGAAAQGLGVLALDEQYASETQDRGNRRKPRNVGEGLSLGAQAFGHAVVGGIKGLIAEPSKAMEERGLEGFFEGLGRGVVGALVKPVAGAFELTALAAGGIQEAAGEASGVTRKMHEKCRPARVLYGTGRIMKLYNPTHAKLGSFLPYIQGFQWYAFVIDSIVYDRKLRYTSIVNDDELLTVALKPEPHIDIYCNLWHVIACEAVGSDTSRDFDALDKRTSSSLRNSYTSAPSHGEHPSSFAARNTNTDADLSSSSRAMQSTSGTLSRKLTKKSSETSLLGVLLHLHPPLQSRYIPTSSPDLARGLSSVINRRLEAINYRYSES